MRLLAAILLVLAVAAPAGVVIRDNDVTEITGGPTTNTLTLTHGEKLTYRIASVQGTNVVPWTGATAVTGLLYDVRLGDLVARGTGVINSAAAGVFTVHFVTPAILEPGPYYELQAVVYSLTGAVGTIAWDPATVARSESSESSGATINISNRFDSITSEVHNYYTSGVTAVNGQTGAVRIVVTSGGTLTTNVDGTLELAATGAAQSPATNTIDLAGNQITNGAAKLTQLHLGPDVTDSGTNNVALTGRATFGVNSKGNVALGNGITFSGPVTHSTAGGSNVTVQGSFTLTHGRTLKNDANYSTVMGADNAILSGAHFSTIAGGWQITNAGASYVSQAGGYRNTVGAAALYAAIGGGASNQVDGIGGRAIGHSGYVPSTTTNSLVINFTRQRRTNSVPHSVAVYADDSVRIQVGGMVFSVSTGIVSAVIGTSSLVYAESGLTVNGVVK